MYSLLLAIIYISFISLGLGDSLLGSAWPVMHTQLGVPVAYAGIISMTIAAGTVISSLSADRLIRILGTRFVVILSVCTTAAALFGFSISGSFLLIWLWALPYGFGAGALDATINNYAAVNYKSKHMNWLHSFWGLGAMTGPYIMGFYLTRGFEWTSGYRAIAFIQLVFIMILLGSLSLWKKPERTEKSADRPIHVKTFPQLLNIRGVKYVLLAFFGYSALETTTALWASTYLAVHRGISAEIAAGFASLFFIGITGGRFLSGFISDRLGNKNMIKTGIFLIFAGIMAVGLPLEVSGIYLAGLIIIGFGCAPVFPAVIHSTPENFGTENSQALVGLQMASAYTGSALMPPLFGLIANNIGMGAFPIFLLFFAVILLVMTTALNKSVKPAG